MANTQRIGQHTEEAACKLLEQHQLKILERNYYCRLGEIDIIAQDNNTLVFVEVRRRSHRQFGSGFDSVDFRKQRKLIKTARYFLLERHFFEKYPCRFDIVSADSRTHLNWIKDAFQA